MVGQRHGVSNNVGCVPCSRGSCPDLYLAIAHTFVVLSFYIRDIYGASMVMVSDGRRDDPTEARTIKERRLNPGF